MKPNYPAFLAIFFLVATLSAADPAAIAKQARTWRSGRERQILAEFFDLLAIPNLASDAANIERNASAVRALCEKRGLTTRLLTLQGAPPIVIADLLASGAQRTIAFYAHYDGQPVDRSRWRSDPWQPVMRDASGKDIDWHAANAIDPEWRLYARSAGDDKAPIIAMLAATDFLRTDHLQPAFNLRLVFEGEEEAGSPHLAQYLEKYAKELHPDAWVLCDGPVHQSRRAELSFGARGTIDLELTVYGPVKGLHDGHYGNWVPNPIVRLTHLIDSMRDENGRRALHVAHVAEVHVLHDGGVDLGRLRSVEIADFFHVRGRKGRGEHLIDLAGGAPGVLFVVEDVLSFLEFAGERRGIGPVRRLARIGMHV